MRAVAVVVVLLAGAPAAAAPAKSPPKACMPADSTFSFAHFDGNFTACPSDGTCLHLDLATKGWTAVTPSDATLATGGRIGQVESDAKGFQLCPVGTATCEPLVLPGVDMVTGDVTFQAATNADHSLLAISRAQGDAQVFDVATKKLLYKVKAQSLAMGPFIQGLEFAGDLLYVRSASTPVSAAGQLVRARTGKLVATVGGKGHDIDDAAPVVAGGTQWAFALWNMEGIVVIDEKSGQQVKKLTYAGTGPKDKPNGELVLFTVLADGRLLAVPATPAIPVQLFDMKTGKRETIAVPRC